MAPCQSRWFQLSVIAACTAAALLIPAASAQTSAPGTQPATPAKHSGIPCVSHEEAAQDPNRDLCVGAHDFALVELADGMRFVDVCPADQSDDQYRFTPSSASASTATSQVRFHYYEVGDLRKQREPAGQNPRHRRRSAASYAPPMAVWESSSAMCASSA
jgi:hypothetical protein